MPGTTTEPIIKYRREPVNEHALTAVYFCGGVLKRLSHARRQELASAHSDDTLLLAHLCWWIEKVDVWLNEQPKELPDYSYSFWFDDFIDERVARAAADWLCSEYELPLDVADIMTSVVEKAIADRKDE